MAGVEASSASPCRAETQDWAPVVMVVNVDALLRREGRPITEPARLIAATFMANLGASLDFPVMFIPPVQGLDCPEEDPGVDSGGVCGGEDGSPSNRGNEGPGGLAPGGSPGPSPAALRGQP